MTGPGAASPHPAEGATPAARQSPLRGVHLTRTLVARKNMEEAA